MRWGNSADITLEKWFLENKREMPWRSDPTPYHVLVSEVMLQQTRVETVIPYYFRFLRVCPDFRALSTVSDERLLKLWEGLGYYQRARNLRKLAKVLTENYGGTLPADYDTLLTLPGIGPYTAGAVMSIAYHQPVPLVDGNVLRVLTRYFGLYDDIGNEETKKKLSGILRAKLLRTNVDPSIFNQGLMEIGAVCCIPNGMPHCSSCPFYRDCKARKEDQIAVIPVKEKKTAVLTEKKTAVIFRFGEKIGIVKRKDGLLRGMYGYPMLEGRIFTEELRKRLNESKIAFSGIRALPAAGHVFSHRIWKMSAFIVELKDGNKTGFSFAGEKVRLVPEEKIKSEMPMPKAFQKWDID